MAADSAPLKEGRLPGFLLVGVPKAGTTTLAAWVGEHPDVFMVPEKEIHFFHREWHRGPEWYRSRFADAEPHQVAGEATPNYLYGDEVQARIQQVVPGARLIVVLREPVARTWANYRMWASLGGDPRSFAQVVRHRHDRLPDYLAWSEYPPDLESLADRFGRSAVHVLFFEEMLADPQTAVDAVWRFIGVPPGVAVNQDRHDNATRQVRSPKLQYALRSAGAWRWPGRVGIRLMKLNTSKAHARIPPALEAELRERFREPNARLQQWLGRPLPPNWTV